MKSKGYQQSYRVGNGPEYNAALVRRGGLTVWVDNVALGGWCASKCPGQRGSFRLYSDLAIECMAMLKAVYGLKACWRRY